MRLLADGSSLSGFLIVPTLCGSERSGQDQGRGTISAETGPWDLVVRTAHRVLSGTEVATHDGYRSHDRVVDRGERRT